jgi:hypothetical protein
VWLLLLAIIENIFVHYSYAPNQLPMVERVTQLPHTRRRLSSAAKGVTKERGHVHRLQVSPWSKVNNVIRFETHHLGIVTPSWHGPHLLQK